MKKRFSMKLAGILATSLIICLVIGMLCLPVGATNKKVNAAKRGVMQVNLVYRDDTNSEIRIASGSGFLLNPQNIVTCAHVINTSKLTNDDLAFIISNLGLNVTPEKFRAHLGYSVTIARDVTVKATVQVMSEEMDFAILTLSQSINNAEPLKIREVYADVNPLEQTETVYAIGFPDESSRFAAVTTYISDEATITQGVVNKISISENLYSHQNTKNLQTSCKLTNGNSGGPMVDENGYVVGVCEGSIGEGADANDYFFAVVIDQVTEVCDKLGIPYEKASVPEPGPVTTVTPTPPITNPGPTVDYSALNKAISDAQKVKKDSVGESDWNKLQDALNAAKNQLDSDRQSSVDSAASNLNSVLNAISVKTEKKSESEGLDTTLIILIAAAAAVVIIIVIVIIAVSSSKKKAKRQAIPARQPNMVPPAVNQIPQYNPGGYVPPQRPVAPPPVRTETMPLSPSGETTVLKPDAGETTVLSKNVNGGTLTRVKTGERISISKEELTIGRERTRVDYCIADNTSISRLHAKLIVRGNQTFIVDQNAANGTFVDGVKASPRQEIPLRDGAKITLAAEDFVYHV